MNNLTKLKRINQIQKRQLIILILLLSLTITLIVFSITIFKKPPLNKKIIYQTNQGFLQVYNTNKTPEVQEEIIEKQPIIIKKGSLNDQEDGKNKYTDSSMSNAKVSSIDDALSMYETPGTSIGIDVSKYQGNINWAQVKQSGVEFAIIRCGYRGYGSGQILMDPYFEQNISEALKNGIKVGVYFFSAAINEQEALEEARWTKEVIKNYKITYPVAYDFESFGLGRLAGLTKSQITANAIAFMNYIKSAGYTPMMYASKNAYYERFETSLFYGCKFWLAHYTDATDYKGTYHMWQYTSKGTVPGINGYVDMNIAYFKYSHEAPPKEETPKPNPPVEEAPQNTLEFKDNNDEVITLNDTSYYLDYKNDEISGIIKKDSILKRLSVSSDNVWSKVSYNNQEVYIKTINLSINNNHSNDENNS